MPNCAGLTRRKTQCTRRGTWAVELRVTTSRTEPRTVYLCAAHAETVLRARPPRYALTLVGPLDPRDVRAAYRAGVGDVYRMPQGDWAVHCERCNVVTDGLGSAERAWEWLWTGNHIGWHDLVREIEREASDVRS